MRITQTRSIIGQPKRQKATVRALGLRRLGHTVNHTPSPAIQGMVRKVRHLITVENS